MLLFRRCERVPGGFQESLCIDPVQIQIEIHFRQIALVLRAVVRAEPDRIAVVVQRQAGHHRIEIDHADPASGRLVYQDIIQFCIVVRDAQREFPGVKKIHQHGAVLFSGEHKLRLLPDVLCAAAGILPERPLEIAEPVARIMEPRDRLVQGGCVVARKEHLELPERLSALVELLRPLHRL